MDVSTLCRSGALQTDTAHLLLLLPAPRIARPLLHRPLRAATGTVLSAHPESKIKNKNNMKL